MKCYTCDICGAEIKESTAENGVPIVIRGKKGYGLNVRCTLENYEASIFGEHSPAKKAHVCASCAEQILKITWVGLSASVNPRVKELWGAE